MTEDDRRYRDARIESQFRAGFTMAEIGARVGLSEKQISVILKKRRVPRSAGGASVRARRRKTYLRHR